MALFGYIIYNDSTMNQQAQGHFFLEVWHDVRTYCFLNKMLVMERLTEGAKGERQVAGRGCLSTPNIVFVCYWHARTTTCCFLTKKMLMMEKLTERSEW